MGLVIASAEVQRLAEELARRQGKPVEEAVKGALERVLAEEQPSGRAEELPGEDLVEWIRKFSEEGRSQGVTSDHSCLYDEHGLPA
jgi:hypothetical protein